MIAGFYAVVPFGADAAASLRSIHPHLLALLTESYFDCSVTDFNALLLNAEMSARQVFHAQLAAPASTVPFNLILTPLLGQAGPMLSQCLTAIVYALFTHHQVRRHPALTPTALP